jgi:hypothetical protein
MKKLAASLIVLSFMLTAFLGCKEDEFIKIPFEADFYTDLAGFEPSESCGDFILNTQTGAGTATKVGEFTTDITFCVDPATFAYYNAVGSFVTELGDELFFVAKEGQILPSPDPDYLYYFEDPFEFTGGTGRFAGARGEGTTYSYVNLDGIRTEHIWKGKLVLRK